MNKTWWEWVVLLEFLDLEWEQNFLDAMQNLFMASDEVTGNAPFACIIWVAIVLYRFGSCAEFSNFSFFGFMKRLELPPGTK